MIKQIFNVVLFWMVFGSNVIFSAQQSVQPIQQNRSPVTRFFDAVECGNTQEVQRLLGEGVNKNVLKNNVGDTALIVATQHQKREMVQFLIERGFDKNRRNELGQSPVLIAAHNNDVGIIQDLCCRGEQPVDVNIEDEWKNSPLHIAADNDNGLCVELLIVHGKSDPKKKNILGCTPLHHACAKGSLSAVKSLLAHGGKDALYMLDNGSRPPLHWALINERDDIVQELLDVDGHQYCQYINGESLLGRFCRNGNLRAVKKLIFMGALKDDHSSEPVLYVALKHGHTDIAKTLFNAGAPKILRHAALSNDLKTLQAVLDLGVDKNEQNNEGYTALHEAVLCGYAEAVQALLAARVDVTLKNHKGETPLDLARKTNRQNIVELLEQYQSPVVGCSCAMQ